MAECAVARCVQERRSFKKELQKWGKNVLFLAGLERVAEELVGREKWKRHMTPITDIDKKVVVDWEPDDLCCFCNGQKQPAPDPAKGVCTIDGLPLYNGATESDGNLSEDARLTPSPPPDQPLDLSMGSKAAVAYSSPHSPSADSGDATSTVLKVPQVPLKPGMKKRFDTAGCKRSYTDDELQAALRDIQSGKLGTRRAAVIYGIPRSTLRNKVYKLALERDGADGPRHSRSKAAAVAALSMEELVCNNGGLEATTSASESLRQLLRNRMAERAAGSKAVTEAAEHNDNAPSSSSSTSSSLPFFSPLEYGQALAPLLSQVLANVNELALSKLRGSGGALSPEEAAASLSELPDECRLPFLSDLIRRLAEERLEEKRAPNGPKNLNSSSSLNGVNCGTAEDLSVTGSCSNNSASTTNSSNNNSSPQNNVILKIPSYKPMKSLSNSSTGTSSEATVGVSGGNVSGVTSQNSSGSTKLAGRGIGVSLREIIAKSITQRVSTTPTSKSKLDNKDLCNGSSDSSNQGFEEPLAKKPKCCNVSGSGKSGNSEKGGSKEQDKVASAGPAGAGGGGAGETGQQHHKPEKRTRPKRGRYRNYDRDNLAEAVRAVQRGEMSVHRAGSYYGVPHSTLEYKVKERHLLRPRKRDAKNKGNGGVPAATPVAATVGDASGKIPPSQHSNSSTNSSSGASSQNGIKTSAVSVANNDTKGFTGVGVTFPSHLPLWQSSPFFSLDFSQFSPNHFFASQMMRKLQEDALMHAEATSCSPGSSNKADSVSLLSSIIRSGLQAQVHAEAAISKAATRVAKDGSAATSSFSSTMVTGSHKVQDGDIPLNLSEAKVE